MREVHTSIDLAATPQQVWDVLTDFAAYPSWNPFFVSVEGQPHPGSVLVLRTKFFQRLRPVRSTVTIRRIVPLRRLEWGGGLAAPRLADGEHGFALAPVRNGTRLQHYARFRGLLIPMAGTLVDALERRCSNLNSALKTRVE